MKKIVLALVVLLFASPAWADVNITAAQVGETNEVIISFDASEEDPDLPRAFAINIQLDNDANILEVTPTIVGESIEPDNLGYGIFPGTIIIDALGNVTDAGTPVAEYGDLESDTLPGLDSNGVTIELASLYAPVGVGSPNAPPASGVLVSVFVSKSCTLCISANVSRAGATGVVMEDPDQVVTVNYSECIDVNIAPGECYWGMADYDQWDAVGKPECWCYQRQCRGDADGLKQGSALAGYMYVGTNDLAILISGWKVLEPPKGPGITSVPGGACADFDHAKQGSALAGYMRVGTNDLNVLIAHWKVLEPPKGTGVPADCQPGNEFPD